MVLTDSEKICKQVNFYFSDSNLPYDKYLWNLRQTSANGWIPIEVIAGFKKMKMITDDLEVVVKALKEADSEIYEIDADNKKIRRKGEVVEQDHTVRSIYVKGLPLVDVDAKDPVAELFNLQDKIDEFFSEKGKVLCVRLKKTDGRPKKFKGSAYVEFETAEKAKEVAELKDLELDGQKLEILYKPVYHEKKAEEYKDVPNTPRRKPFQFNAFKSQSGNNKSTGVKRKNDNKAPSNEKKTKTEESENQEAAE